MDILDSIESQRKLKYPWVCSRPDAVFECMDRVYSVVEFYKFWHISLNGYDLLNKKQSHSNLIA